MFGGEGAVYNELGLAEAPHPGYASPSDPSPFFAQDGQAQQLATAVGGSGGSGSGSLVDPAYSYAYLAPGASSGGSSSLPSASYTLSLQDQQSLASGQLPGSMSGQHITYVEVGTAGGLPIMMPQTQYQSPGVVQQQQQQQPQPQPQLSQPKATSNARGGPASKAKQRPKRPYKPPQQVEQERRLKDEANDLIRRLEQQLGKARSELVRLQGNNKMLQRKAVVLSKHSSFRRCTAGMLDELQASMTMGEQLQSMDCQLMLDAAEKGLPERQVLDYLRSMTVETAVQHYNGVVERVRKLLEQLDRGQEPAAARQQLDDIFTLQDTGSTFGYLQVVNPPVYAELMQAQLDATNLVDRNNPSHWRGVLAAMALSEEQESQLILLLQSYLQRSEQIVERKSKVMQELADELCSEMRSLELSSEGGSADIGDLTSEDSNSVAGAEEGDEFAGFAAQRSLSGNAKAQQAKDELDRLVQVEYWLKFDFTGCVRKLLPSQQQALCMVHSWPFYPDQKQLEAAIREKAGPRWEQHARSSH